VSEYQYYEFQALDRPLTPSQMSELRSYSTRARITPTSFVNEYNWGNFKGNRHEWIEKYFDAFLYVANWGSHWLEFRIPKRLLDPAVALSYCAAEGLSCRVKEESVILSFASEETGGDWEEGEGWLASMTPLRSDLMQGDHRCLYLGWLAALQTGEIDDDDLEPPVPPGLRTLSAPLRSLADFLRIDPDLITVAADNSAPEQCSILTRAKIAAWITAMPSTEKDDVIAAVLDSEAIHFVAEFRQRAFREIRGGGESLDHGTRRSAGQLRAHAEAVTEARRVKEARLQARAKAKRDREEAQRRQNYLKSLAGKEEDLWARIDALIATKQPRRYDDALTVLHDLHELAGMTGQVGVFSARMQALCHTHAKKPALLDRFQKAKLIG
jgi:hypothetical protein